jgi:non-heme chloroperoxidase
VPIEDTALLSAKLVKGATVKIISGGSHGICSTHKDQINAELLAFFQRTKHASA